MPCTGGDAFCLFYNAKDGSVRGLNGSGRSPAGLDLALAQAHGGPKGKALPSTVETMDPSSVHCVTVPGAAACWADTVRLFGKLELATVLQPAIELAEGGYPVNVIAASLWAEQEEQLTTRWGGLKGNPGAAAMLRPDGKPPKAGEWMRMPELAATFRALATEGPSGFYSGRIAEAIVAALAAHGGVMEAADLAAHATEEVAPISAPFAGHTVHQLPPNGSGLVSLMALRILDALPPLPPPPAAYEKATDAEVAAAAATATAAHLHRVAEALRLAFADGVAHIADPSGSQMADTVKDLLSDSYIASRAALISDDAAMEEALAGTNTAANFKTARSETVYLTAVDAEGNACSFICSNYMGFGSGIVPRGCGFTLQNRGANFAVQSGHPNCVGPRRRPYHTIIPAMVTNPAGELVASFGVMGGFMQPQGHVQVLSHVLKHGLDPQLALDMPRLCIEPAEPLPHSLQDEATRKRTGVVLHLEDGFPPETAARLTALGHKVISPHARLQRDIVPCSAAT